MNNFNTKPSATDIILGVLLLVAIGLGSYARLNNIDERQIAEDAMYLVKSVEFLIEKGVPELPNGGYYFRCLPLQAIQAASVKLFGDSLFSYRIPIVVLSFLTLYLCFKYSKLIVNKRAALIITAILFISSWELEFTHFIRMYIPFQCVTLAFLISLPRLELESNKFTSFLPFLALLLCVTIHKIAITLVPVLFLYQVAIFIEHKKVDFPKAIALVTTCVSAILYIKIPAWINRKYIIEDDLQNPEGTEKEMLALPEHFFWSFSDNAKINLTILCSLAGIAALGAIALLWRTRIEQKAIGALSAAALVFAIGHQLLPVALLFFPLIFRYDAWKIKTVNKLSLVFILGAIAISGFWAIYCLANLEMITTNVTPRTSEAIRETLLGWPDPYKKTISAWKDSLPLLSAAFGLSMLIHLVMIAKKPLTQIFKDPILPILFFGALVSLVEPPLAVTRYSFYLYPIFLTILILSLRDLTIKLKLRESRAIVMYGGITISLFMVSKDFFPHHLLHFTKPEAQFRLNRYNNMQLHWYKRYDTKSVAEKANELVPDGAPLIVSSRVPAVYYYLEKDHVAYYPSEYRYGAIVNIDNGLAHKWTGKSFYRNNKQLIDYTNGFSSAWMIRVKNAHPYPDFLVADDIWTDREFTTENICTGIDGKLELVKISFSNAD